MKSFALRLLLVALPAGALVTACASTSASTPSPAANDAGTADGGAPALTEDAGPTGALTPYDAGPRDRAGHVFQAPSTVSRGALLWLQGDGFGAAPRVLLDTASGWEELPLVNHVDGVSVVARLPATFTKGRAVVRVDNGEASTDPVALDAPRLDHLDALSLTAGARFRIVGRNLLAPDRAPIVRLDGLDAEVDFAGSDDSVILATAPAGLAPTAAVTLTVDTLRGYPAATLGRPVAVLAGSGDGLGIGGPWPGVFTDLAARRRAAAVVADGVRDDGPAIQAALDATAAAGGGVVELPARTTIRLASTLHLPSGVVLRGAGKTATTLVYEGQWAVFAEGVERAGLADLGFRSKGATEALVLQRSRRVFLANVRVETAGTFQSYLGDDRDLLVKGSDFVQSRGKNGQGPLTLGGSAGVLFEDTHVAFGTGAPDLQRVHDAVIARSTFTRDATNQNLTSQSDGVTHSLVIDFAHHLAVLANTFDTANGRVTNLARNDGETILTEGGGAARTENVGTVETATERTIRDGANTFVVDPFGEGRIPESYGVWIVGGKGAGQVRHLQAYDAATRTLTVDAPWTVLPDATSRYATFVPGLETALLRGNTLRDNSRGIWLYQTAVHDVDIAANDLRENGGIYLRAWQHVEPGVARMFCPQYGVRIHHNLVADEAGTNTAYATALFVKHDASDVGLAFVGIDFEANVLMGNRPAFTSPLSDLSSVREGYRAAVFFENVPYRPPTIPWVLAPIFQGSSASPADPAVYLGTGVGGAVVADTKAPPGRIVVDQPTGGASEGALGTVVTP